MTMSGYEPRLVHEALVYSSEDEFLARLVPFLRDGFAAGEPAIVVLTPNKNSLLREALGPDARRVSFTDARTVYRRPARALAEFRRQLDAELSRPGATVVRVIGEIPLGPAGHEHAEWMRYESVVNQAFAGYPALIICLYDTRALPETVVADALHTHPFVATGNQLQPNADYIETDESVERPVRRKAEPGDRGDLLGRLTVGKESDLGELRRAVAGAARAAGLPRAVVDDVTVAVGELVRDAHLHSEGDASVEVARDGARWRCEVIDGASDQTARDARIGLSIARLISDRVELASGARARAHSVRMTFTGAPDARQRLLDAASELFYQNGIRATGINTIISHSGVAKATFFKHFPAKDDLVIAWLQQPASRWFDRIGATLDARAGSPASKLLGFFDLLGEWFAQDDFRGCAFQNAAAETPEPAHPVRQASRAYALEIQRYLRRTASDAGLSHPARIAEQLHLLALGAIATAVATRSPEAATVARAAARRVLAPPTRQPT